MKYIVFVSIDNPKRWGEWHSGPTDFVYYSDFLETKAQADDFMEQVKKDYPDNNLIDGTAAHDNFIKYVVLQYDQNDKDGFDTLCRMMRAYGNYENRMV